MVDRLDEYRQGWLSRQRELDVAAERWRGVAWELLETAVPALVAEFGLRSVTVFGSLARGEAGPGSDVDLLVEGLAPNRLWDACAAVDRLMHPVPVDLVPKESARPEIVARAMREGRSLHGA